MELTLAELKDAVGTDLGHSDWMAVEQPRIDIFAEATDDHQWIHVDPKRAEQGPFGTTIAHGYLTLSLVPRLLKGMLRLTDQGRGTNYGLEKVRFTDVVPAGSQVRLGASVGAVEERKDGGMQYMLDVRIERDGSTRPVMVGTVVYLAYPSQETTV